MGSDPEFIVFRVDKVCFCRTFIYSPAWLGEPPEFQPQVFGTLSSVRVTVCVAKSDCNIIPAFGALSDQFNGRLNQCLVFHVSDAMYFPKRLTFPIAGCE